MAENPTTRAPDPKPNDAANTPAAPSAAPKPDDDLNPLDMEGKGQNLPDSERTRAEHAAKLAELRAKNEETAQKTEFDLMREVRAAHAKEQEAKRERAVAASEEQRDAMVQTRKGFQVLAADPSSLALEAALSARLAEELEQDETVPGGAYVVGNDLVDADGRRIGKAPKD